MSLPENFSPLFLMEPLTGAEHYFLLLLLLFFNNRLKRLIVGVSTLLTVSHQKSSKSLQFLNYSLMVSDE